MQQKILYLVLLLVLFLLTAYFILPAVLYNNIPFMLFIFQLWILDLSLTATHTGGHP